MTMANIQTNSFIHNTGLNEENSLSHLINAMSPDSENESTLIDHLAIMVMLNLNMHFSNIIVKYAY